MGPLVHYVSHGYAFHSACGMKSEMQKESLKRVRYMLVGPAYPNGNVCAFWETLSDNPFT